MTPLPPDFSLRLQTHMQGLRHIKETAHLSPAEAKLVGETQELLKLMLDRPDLSHPFASEWVKQDCIRRTQSSIRQSMVIWRRVNATVSEAVEVAGEIGRVQPDMVHALDTLALFVEKNMPELSQSQPLLDCIDKLESVSQSLRTKTREAKSEFRGKPHPNSHHTSVLAEFAQQWKSPVGPTKLLEGLRAMQSTWARLETPQLVRTASPSM